MNGAVSRRSAARVIAAAAVLCAAGSLPAPGSAAEGQDSGAVYRCEAPSGAHEATVVVSGTFPESGAVVEPIGPEDIAVDVTLPADSVRSLLPEGTASFRGTAVLTVGVGRSGETAEARWPGLVSPPVALPAEDAAELEIRHTGTAAPVTVGAPGDVVFTAERLVLVLAPESGPSPAPADTSGSARLDCVPDAERNPPWATVRVPEPGGPRPETPGPAEGEAEGEGEPDAGITVDAPPAEAAECPPKPPEGELDPRRLPEPPPGAVEGSLDGHGCVVPAGYANVRKLNGAMVVNDPRKKPGTMNLGIGKRTVQAEGYLEQDTLGDLSFPDSTSTFLTFGFQPTTAEVEFETEPATIVQVIRDGRSRTTIGYYQHLRLHDVRVNGVPLDVGPECRTSRPVDTSLEGGPDYDVVKGGSLTGEITIPPFSGCGTGGEDLDPLFTAAISGPGNHLSIVQGPVCWTPACRPEVPQLPQH